MRYIRQGTCNKCGECCGAAGGPDRRPPFAKNWPDCFKGWKYEDVIAVCPLLVLLGVIAKPDGTPEAPNRYGSIRVVGGGQPQTFYWVYVEGVGICKDTSEAHDGSSYDPQCPFLLDDPGDGTRPCGLVGTNEEGRFIAWCQDEPTSPRREELVLEWIWRHPHCSYTWVEEE